jgi:hypothetical protein
MRSVCGSFGKYEREQKWIQGYAGETGRKDHLEDISVEGRTVLKSISNNSAGKAGVGLIWISKGEGMGCCRGGNGHSDIVICEHLLV